MISVTIWGEPHPQGRPRATRRGKFASVYEDPRDKGWKEAARWEIISQLPVDGDRPVFRSGIPLHVTLTFVFPCPKADHRKRVIKPVRWHVTKPDGDNLEKSVLDSANGVIWHDDCQVCKVSKEKVIGQQIDKPRVIMMVEPILIDPHKTWR